MHYSFFFFYGFDGHETLPVESPTQKINNSVRKYIALWF